MLVGRQYRELCRDIVGMLGEDLTDQGLAHRGQGNPHVAAIGPAPLPLYQPSPLQIVHDKGHIAGGAEDFPRQVGLMERSEVVKRIEHPELAFRQVVLGESAGEPGTDRVGGPGELHPGTHGEPLIGRGGCASHQILKR